MEALLSFLKLGILVFLVHPAYVEAAKFVLGNRGISSERGQMVNITETKRWLNLPRESGSCKLFKSLLENPALSNGNFASCINWDKIIDCLRQSLEGGKSLKFENIEDAVAYFQHDEGDTAKDWAVLRIFDGRQSIRHWFPHRQWCPVVIPPTDDNLMSRITFKLAKREDSFS